MAQEQQSAEVPAQSEAWAEAQAAVAQQQRPVQAEARLQARAALVLQRPS
jgi:hypothetical protein